MIELCYLALFQLFSLYYFLKERRNNEKKLACVPVFVSGLDQLMHDVTELIQNR